MERKATATRGRREEESERHKPQPIQAHPRHPKCLFFYFLFPSWQSGTPGNRGLDTPPEAKNAKQQAITMVHSSTMARCRAEKDGGKNEYARQFNGYYVLLSFLFLLFSLCLPEPRSERSFRRSRGGEEKEGWWLGQTEPPSSSPSPPPLVHTKAWRLQLGGSSRGVKLRMSPIPFWIAVRNHQKWAEGLRLHHSICSITRMSNAGISQRG